MGQGLGTMGDTARPGSQGIRGFPRSPSLCGVPRCREGGTAGIDTSSFRKLGATSPSIGDGQLAAVKVRIDSFAGWEELIMNETAAAPSNTEHELLLEVGRFLVHFPSEVTKRSRKDLLFSISRRAFATSTRRSAVWGEGHRKTQIDHLLTKFIEVHV